MKLASNGKFIRSDKLGETLRHYLALDYTFEIILHNRLGDGEILFHHPRICTCVVRFKEWNVNDDVEVSYNDLGTIIREYSKED